MNIHCNNSFVIHPQCSLPKIRTIHLNLLKLLFFSFFLGHSLVLLLYKDKFSLYRQVLRTCIVSCWKVHIFFVKYCSAQLVTVNPCKNENVAHEYRSWCVLAVCSMSNNKFSGCIQLATMIMHIKLMLVKMNVATEGNVTNDVYTDILVVKELF